VFHPQVFSANFGTHKYWGHLSSAQPWAASSLICPGKLSGERVGGLVCHRPVIDMSINIVKSVRYRKRSITHQRRRRRLYWVAWLPAVFQSPPTSGQHCHGLRSVHSE